MIVRLMESINYICRPKEGELGWVGMGTILPGLCDADYLRDLIGKHDYDAGLRLGIIRPEGAQT